ncbi:hypothetical protein VNI00_015036 [Paramarasmius palmivorus]|uniref:CxC2-like cysteine cluster KDZ transposase-associated domain-containing protein n=1 Tax=Paramarasmius palmivorus TaxID=297713 RepID=A0AAW0BPR4_9AGAR
MAKRKKGQDAPALPPNLKQIGSLQPKDAPVNWSAGHAPRKRTRLASPDLDTADGPSSVPDNSRGPETSSKHETQSTAEGSGGDEMGLRDQEVNEGEDNESKSSDRYQGISSLMEEFRSKHDILMDYLLMHESDETLGEPCNCGRDTRSCFCDQCQHLAPSCVECFIEAHHSNPWHWAQYLIDGRIEQRDITQLKLGYAITVGHPRSAAIECENLKSSPCETRAFTVIHYNGIHQTNVFFCTCCLADDADRFSKLLRSRIFPCSVQKPQVGVTFETMRQFHVHTLTSKKSAYDYVEALARLTNNAFPQDVKDIYRQFLRAHRVWAALIAQKRAGLAHGMDGFFPNRRPKSVIVPCFSCPERGFNVDDTMMTAAPERYIHLVQLTLSIDGHFGLQRFQKTSDPDDVSLLQGQGFFPKDQDYDVYVNEVVAHADEKSSCSRFNAIEMQNKLKFKGCTITGVLGVQCGRHAMFLSMVDLQRGERFANADYALYYALLHYTYAIRNSNLTEAAKWFRRILLLYDVVCQFRVNLPERFQLQFPDLAPVIEVMRTLIPKMHLYGHVEPCKYKYSLNFYPSSGRTHGEGIETSWSESKQAGGSTRQMNHGHRHDKIIDNHNEWNWVKLMDMAASLERHLKEACLKVDEMVTFYVESSRILGKDLVDKWLAEAQAHVPFLDLRSSEQKKKDKTWSSPFQLNTAKLMSEGEALKQLQEEDLTRQRVPGVPSNTAPTLQWISLGIDIQRQQRRLHQLKRNHSSEDDIDRTTDLVSKALITLREIQLQDIPALSPLIDAIAIADLSLEKEPVLLPSDLVDSRWQAKLKFSLSARHDDPFAIAVRLGDCSRMELKLREGEANDAISQLCNIILHAMLVKKEKEKRARGVKQNLKSMKFIRTIIEKRGVHASTYTHARRCILRLTGQQSDKNYPPLTQEDLWAKNAVDSIGLGEGKQTDSWIWTYGQLRDLDQKGRNEFIDEVKRVRWFRAYADVWRWIEEKEILEEEFRRFIRACERMASIWNDVAVRPPPAHSELSKAVLTRPSAPATTPPPNSGYVIYARSKAHMYTKMGMDARQRFTTVGGGWPAPAQDLWNYLDKRRPDLTIQWVTEENDDVEELKDLEAEIINMFEQPIDEDDLE